jgi:hypothetical protein
VLTVPRIALLPFAFLMALAVAPPEQPRVSLLVRPTFMIARGDIRIEARVPRDADNRQLTIAWDSDGGSVGNTMRPLEGEGAPVLHTLNLPSQIPANYRFVATLFNQVGKVRGRAEARIHVPEAGGTK